VRKVNVVFSSVVVCLNFSIHSNWPYGR
jgi:hypothetical protein